MKIDAELDELFGHVLEKLRTRGGVSDSGNHFAWEPVDCDGVRYQHIRWGPWGICDTFHSAAIAGVPDTPFYGDVPAKDGDPQFAELIVRMLNHYAASRSEVDE